VFTLASRPSNNTTPSEKRKREGSGEKGKEREETSEGKQAIRER
jgi:hypothetical protein